VKVNSFLLWSHHMCHLSVVLGGFEAATPLLVSSAVDNPICVIHSLGLAQSLVLS
jgi:hypothetical protein